MHGVFDHDAQEGCRESEAHEEVDMKRVRRACVRLMSRRVFLCSIYIYVSSRALDWAVYVCKTVRYGGEVI